jgi:hypothetical protein
MFMAGRSTLYAMRRSLMPAVDMMKNRVLKCPSDAELLADGQ